MILSNPDVRLVALKTMASLDAPRRLTANLLEAGRVLSDTIGSRFALPAAARATVTGLFDIAETVPRLWTYHPTFLQAALASEGGLLGHCDSLTLLEIICGKTDSGPRGFPLLAEASFRSFVETVPPLFVEGGNLLTWLGVVERSLQNRRDIAAGPRESVLRGVKALRTMVFTAAITAPPNLWLLRHILSIHKRSGTLRDLNAGREIRPDQDQLQFDLRFLHALGYLDRTVHGFIRTRGLPARVLEEVTEIPDEFLVNVTHEIRRWLEGGSDREAWIRSWLRIDTASSVRHGWIANLHQVEVGYRLVPLLLALQSCGLIEGLKAGDEIKGSWFLAEARTLLEKAGWLHRGRVTLLGARAFERGPGVAGIIEAYHPYLLRGQGPSVERGTNIAASRNANRKSFRDAVQSFRKFCNEYDFRPRVVIEQAMGLGIGLQEFEREFGSEDIQFIGTDLEDASLFGARREQTEGRLPESTHFLPADIGDPQKLIRYMRERGIPTQGAVMIVGNGFQEIRDQTDGKMIEIFRAYREAGIILLFIEESSLTDQQIRAAGWNTYHAAFRWTHETSRQTLRPPWRYDPPHELTSWSELVSSAGYEVLYEYSEGKRRVFPIPIPLPSRQNPPISYTFLCIPDLWEP